MSTMRDDEVVEFLTLLRRLPQDRRDWFVDQLHRMDRGEPNAIEGTAPDPYADRHEQAAA